MWEENGTGDPGDLHGSRGPVRALISGPSRLTSDPDDSIDPDVIWTGTGYGVVWTDTRDGGEPEIFFALLNTAGFRTTADIQITDEDASPRVARRPRLAWTGSAFGVTWTDNRGGIDDGWFASFDTAGFKQEDDRLVAPGGAEIDMAFGGNRHVVAWRDPRHSTFEVYARALVCDCDDPDGDGALHRL